MDVISSNVLENLIFRANIFNYDNKFLLEVKDKLKLDFTHYSQGIIIYKC